MENQYKVELHNVTKEYDLYRSNNDKLKHFLTLVMLMSRGFGR